MNLYQDSVILSQKEEGKKSDSQKESYQSGGYIIYKHNG